MLKRKTISLITILAMLFTTLFTFSTGGIASAAASKVNDDNAAITYSGTWR